MQNTIARARIDDELDLKSQRATLKEALAWVRHWQTDISFGLTPTPESLKTVELMISASLEAVR